MLADLLQLLLQLRYLLVLLLKLLLLLLQLLLLLAALLLQLLHLLLVLHQTGLQLGGHRFRRLASLSFLNLNEISMKCDGIGIQLIDYFGQQLFLFELFVGGGQFLFNDIGPLALLVAILISFLRLLLVVLHLQD